jgi:hypothetical protein
MKKQRRRSKFIKPLNASKRSKEEAKETDFKKGATYNILKLRSLSSLWISHVFGQDSTCHSVIQWPESNDGR